MRTVQIERNTLETQISLNLNLDGTGISHIDTGVGFLDHMLNLFTRHARFDLQLVCKGDLHIDCHHSVEDIGLALGMAFAKALGDMRGIKRYGSFLLPMDESLAMVVIDLSGRPYLHYDVHLPAAKVGDFDTETVKEFFYGMSRKMNATIHIQLKYGENTHHIIEAIFKGYARALAQAVEIDPRLGNEIPSTKRLIDMIAIVDYGVGNIFSIQSSLQFLGIESCVTASPEVLHNAQSIILPGVGAYGDAIAKLRTTGLDQVLLAESKLDKPILGICLGMQLLFDVGHEFGSHPGLGILPGEVCDLCPQIPSLKVPHMGWNQLNIHQQDELSEGIVEKDWVYYVHSFYVKCTANLIHSSSNYGIDVPGIVRKNKLIGMQFHPEKSGTVGLQLLKNFAKL